MKISLGTVQFGLNYGVTNTGGQVALGEVEKILTYAQEVGVDCLDTAIAYGNSEEILGHFDLSSFQMISKIPELGNKALNTPISYLVEQSLKRLKMPKLYGLLLHAEHDLVGEHADFVFEQLTELKKQGLVDKIGVSFYSPVAAKQIICQYPLDLIQVPANQIDNRFAVSGVLALAHGKQIEVHARSLFLQGLLVTAAEKRPDIFLAHPDLLNFDKVAKENNLSQLELALSYFWQKPEINKAVIGCLSVEQLSEMLACYQRSENLNISIGDLSSKDEYLINPSLWKTS